MHLKIAAQLFAPGRLLLKQRARICQREKIPSNDRRSQLLFWRVVDPALNAFGDERTNRAKLAQRPILRDQIGDLLGPEKCATRGATVSADKNSRFLLGFAREKFREIGIREHTSESIVLAALSCFRLETVELGFVRFDEFGAFDREILVQDLSEFLCQDNRNGASVLGVDRNWK